MKSVAMVLAAGLAGVALALLSISRRTPNESPAGLESADGVELTSGEAGSAIVDSPETRIAKSREMAKSMLDGIKEIPSEQWLREWELIERSGKKMGSRELKGQPYIASFFFSTCPSVCVRQNDQVRLLQEKFRKLPIRLVSITCDPELDTPERLAEYAERFDANDERWLFFTGEWDYLQRVSAEVFFHGLHRPKEHIEKFLLMDANGQLVAAYDWHDPEELEVLEADVRKLLVKEES